MDVCARDREFYLYIGNNFDHIFKFDHISDSSLIMYLSLPILSVLECHSMCHTSANTSVRRVCT